MAEVDRRGSILVISWVLRKGPAMELGTDWTFAVRSCWDCLLLL